MCSLSGNMDSEKHPGLLLRDEITFRRIGEHNLFILPRWPSWVVLSDIEAITFRFFVDGLANQSLIDKVCSFGFDKDSASASFVSLIGKLKDRRILPLPQKLERAPEPEAFQRNVHLCLTHECNLRCKHCYISAGKKSAGELSLVEWKTGFEKLLKFLKNPNVTISGGEPTVVSFLPNLAQYLRSRGCSIGLYTNGTIDADEIWRSVDHVQVSLEGLSARTHNSIRGVGCFEKIDRVIKKLANTAPEKLTIAVTLMFHNFDEVANRIDEFLKDHSLNREHVRLNAALEDAGRARHMPAVYKSFLEEKAEEVFGFVRSFADTQSRLLLTNIRNCGIGLSIGLDSNGDIYPCDVFHNCFGNILTSDLKEVLDRLRQLNMDTEIDAIAECKFCDLKYICLGGCKVQNLIKDGSYITPTCTESYRLQKYYQMIHDVGV